MAEEDSSTSDESLDVTSEKFDPLKALYSTKSISKKKAPVYDNVSKFEAVLSGLSGRSKVRMSAWLPFTPCPRYQLPLQFLSFIPEEKCAE